MTEDQLRLKIAINLDNNFDQFCLKAKDLFSDPQVLQIIKNKFARKLSNRDLFDQSSKILKGITNINQLSDEEQLEAQKLNLINHYLPVIGNVTGTDISINDLDYSVSDDASYVMATEVLPVISRIVTVPKTAQRDEKLMAIIGVQLTNEEFIYSVFNITSDLNDANLKSLYESYAKSNPGKSLLNYAYYQFISQAEQLKLLNDSDSAPNDLQKQFYKSLITNKGALRGNIKDLENLFQNMFGLDITKNCGVHDQLTVVDGIVIDLRNERESFMNQAQALNIGQRQKIIDLDK